MSPLRKRYAIQVLVVLTFITFSIFFILTAIFNQINNKLEDSYYEKLSVTKSALKENIENYFQNKSNLIITLSENEDIKNATTAFEKDFKKIKSEYSYNLQHDMLLKQVDEHIKKVVYDIPNAPKKKQPIKYIPVNGNGIILQSLYILNNKFDVGEKYKLYNSPYDLSYDKTHKQYHQKFLNILQKHNFYDIFLIDNDGNIIYSVFKELDLGTNLKSGIYSKSSLAKAYKKALSDDQLSFSDFKPYEPSYNEPAAFFAIPLKEKGKTIGTLALQISIDEINSIVTFNSTWEEIGLGKSGEAYLVGDDYLMRSDSRFKASIDNAIVQKLNTTIGAVNVHSYSVTNALNGKNGNNLVKDYRGIEVLSSYTPVKIIDRTWALMVEIDKSEVSKKIDKTINFIAIFFIVSLFILAAVLWIIIVQIIIKPIENFEIELQDKVNEQTKELNQLNKNLQKKVEEQITQLREKDKILLHQSRMTAIAEMMHNIAHQWRQPLAIITMYANTMELELELGENSKEKEKKNLEEIVKQSQYLSTIIDDFTSFFNSDASEKETINLVEVLKKTESLLQGSFEENKINYNADTLSKLYIDANENQLIQVFLNILNNCKDAIIANEMEQKLIFVTLRKDGNNAVITIKDSGGGIAEDILEKIFDPYATTKHQSIGTGLGLYMSYQLITKVYDGLIQVKNINYEHNKQQLKGAEFIITIPLQNNL